MPCEDALQDLGVDGEKGLSLSDVKKRQKYYGPNRLTESKTKSAWSIFADQLKNLIAALLITAAVVSWAFGQHLEGIAIFIALVINILIGFFTELRAVRSMEALQRLSRVTVKIKRGGNVKEIASDRLVPGDIVVLESGDIISADLRLIEASRMQANESALTGESLPVNKQIQPVDGDAPLAERTNMLFKGTSLTMGSGEGIVVATGMATELGRISSLAEEAESEETPLEKRLNRLGQKLVWVTMGIAAVVVGIGLFAKMELLLIIETAIALAVAAIPEGLPIVATIALARGMWRMARRNALVNRLSAVETLGSTTVVCTDKTGTLTENRMDVRKIIFLSGKRLAAEEITIHYSDEDKGEFYRDDTALKPLEHRVLHEALEVGVLCNNAHLVDDGEEDKNVGDPLEIALLKAGRGAGIERDKILESKPEKREEAFDPQSKMMATFHASENSYQVAVKGAPESLLKKCSHIRTSEGQAEIDEELRQQLVDCNNEMAGEGLRVVGIAAKAADSLDDDPYNDLVFLSLFGLLDPPRPGIDRVIKELREAGIKVVMVTGDQAATARNVGIAISLVESQDAPVFLGKNLKASEDISQEEEKELLNTAIFARITPEQKLDLISLHQKNDAIVAMTGDGVNDAPALKKADIGIAMGKRGTQVAREAADIVLKDDSFRTIAVAVEQGRVIFGNIRKFILFLLSGNIGEIMIVAFAILAGAPLPLLPLQILYLNMISDVFPALALGVAKGDATVMLDPPRDVNEPVLTKRHWLAIAGYGLLIAAAVLGAFAAAFLWLNMEKKQAVSVSFLTLAFARTWHVFNMRDRGSPFIRNVVTSNPFVWGAIALSIGLLLLAVYLPPLSLVLKLVDPGFQGWLLIVGMSLIPYAIGQTIKYKRSD